MIGDNPMLAPPVATGVENDLDSIRMSTQGGQMLSDRGGRANSTQAAKGKTDFKKAYL